MKKGAMIKLFTIAVLAIAAFFVLRFYLPREVRELVPEFERITDMVVYEWDAVKEDLELKTDDENIEAMRDFIGGIKVRRTIFVRDEFPLKLKEVYRIIGAASSGERLFTCETYPGYSDTGSGYLLIDGTCYKVIGLDSFAEIHDILTDES
ncbi:MAG: hypothetical protein Q4D04_11595 [Clostridia bacterium]|nr:hypothetical protein [Clostridia bacterium]